jgi:hypothetical protein
MIATANQYVDAEEAEFCLMEDDRAKLAPRPPRRHDDRNDER